jgi:hypothetical protein
MCYNIAFNYLGNKYGFTRVELIPSVREKLRRARNKKEEKEIESKITEEDYPHRINHDNIPEIGSDRTIYLLLTQYYYGSAPKKELEVLLKSMDLM